MAAISDFFDGMHGVLFPFGGSVAPPGFLLCDGKAYSRTTYAALFAVISTNFGAGDGSTTFNVPDVRGRVVGGVDNMGGGTSANRLLLSPSINNLRHTLGGVGGNDVHTLTQDQMPNYNIVFPGKVNQSAVGIAGGTDLYNATSGTTNVSSGGSGNAHDNVQPTIIMNWIIKT